MGYVRPAGARISSLAGRICHQSPAKPLRASPSPVLTGRIVVPGDKSISHRSLMLGAIAIGETVISGPFGSRGCHPHGESHGRAWRGRPEERGGNGGCEGLASAVSAEPTRALDFGNSGTGARLAMGLIASSPSLRISSAMHRCRRRPMGRVMAPLEKIGARFEAAEGGRLPLKLRGARDGVPDHLQAARCFGAGEIRCAARRLNVAGRTRVIEPVATRDHTERMLKAFGAKITVEQQGEARQISLTGQEELRRPGHRCSGEIQARLPLPSWQGLSPSPPRSRSRM